MRPLRLSMTAFGPYAGTEVVDFDALTDLGLFVVAGNNGSGKTTIFDALHYALFGTLPGRRSTYQSLKSDHADTSAECSVTLDFAAHGKHWRVQRSPKQTRPKKRGTGSTEAPAAATLFRVDPAGATAITNRVEEVRAQCQELVGLSGKQFERVALLPQGEFSRVLRESGTERRELLRTLFSSEIFGDATALLSDQAAQATAADRSAFERLDHQQEALAAELGELVPQPITNDASTLQVAIADYRRVQLGELGASAAECESAAATAAHALQAGRHVANRLQRRSQVENELSQHQLALPQHERDSLRLQQARAAVPVASHARSLSQHGQKLASIKKRLAELHPQLNDALASSGVQPVATLQANLLATTAEAIHALVEQFGERREADVRVQDLDTLVKRGMGDLRRLANEIDGLTNQREIAQTQLRQATAELTELESAPDVAAAEQQLRAVSARREQRTELAAADNDHQQAVQRAAQIDQSIERVQADHAQAQQAQSSQATLQRKADTAFASFEESTRRQRAANRYQAAALRLGPARQELEQARSHADQLWDAFIAGTAARVAETLVDDEPCPVCGSSEHPAPATPDPSDGVAEIVTEAVIAEVRNHVEVLHNGVREIETEIESLRAIDADIAALSPTELAAEITTTKAMALGARTVADNAQRAASQLERLTAELAQARTAAAEAHAELRGLDERRNRLHGALGEFASEPIASLEAQVEQARQARAKAEHASSRGAQVSAAIARTQQDIETIGLGQIAAESRRKSATDQLETRQAELDVATAGLAKIDEQFTNADASTADGFEQRASAARRALELIGETTTALARQADAADAVRRAQSILDERLNQSPFTHVNDALAAFVAPAVIEQLEAQTASYAAASDRLQGQLHELGDLPDIAPDIGALSHTADETAQASAQANRALITITTKLDRIEHDLASLLAERESRRNADLGTRRLERVAALVKGDNDRNTSLENWVLAAHLRDVVELANVRLARSTHQRFQLCVLDDGENKRGKWGLDLGVEDTVTGTRRPTAGLSGGELFQASLALALGMADAVMNQSAGVRIDALFIDEGFGSLDEISVERAIDLLDELRDRGAMVGVITHVPALLDALPVGVQVVDAADGQGSTIHQNRLAA